MNWGHKLTVFILAFIGFMAFMVYKCYTTTFQLVETEYYKSELRYQNVIDGHKNANTLSMQVQIVSSDNEVAIRFPEELSRSGINGNIWFYCAYEAANDKKLDIKTNNEGVQLFPKSNLAAGTYTVKIEWNDGKDFYYNEQDFSL